MYSNLVTSNNQMRRVVGAAADRRMDTFVCCRTASNAKGLISAGTVD